MHKIISSFLMILAIAAAFAISMHIGLRLLALGTFAHDIFSMYNRPSIAYSSYEIASSCYPFRWQAAKRERAERLWQLLESPITPPKETDALNLAWYAEYARQLRWESTEYEQAMREGMRRDPQNALYHYLLAYRWIKLSLEGEYRTKGAPDGTYAYRVKDRPLLDRAMREVMVGLRLPLEGRHYDLISATLDTMPEARHWEEQVRETAVLGSSLFREYAKMRELARVNGYYFSLLLAEGKRAETEPFLHTGERLHIQVAGDKLPTLNGLQFGLSIHSTCMKDETAVCRRYRLTAETADIERRYNILSGKMNAWKASVDAQATMKGADPFEQMLQRQGSVMLSILMPKFGNLPVPTPADLRPSRLVEYTLIEQLAVSMLPLLFVGLMLYSGLKYWRWRLALAGEEVPPHDMRLSAGDWLRVLLIGFLLPVGLYALYIALPISGRAYNLTTSLMPFAIGAGAFMLWLLIVPTAIAAGAIWGRSMDIGIIEEHRPGAAALFRGLSSVLALIWVAFAARSLVLLPGLLALDLFAISHYSSDRAPAWSSLYEHAAIALLLVILAFLPAVWERRHTDCAQHFLALARAMIPVYAILALCTAALYPALLAVETHYLRQDKVMTTMRTGGTIAFTHAEGRLVLELRGMVLEGAKQLENEKPPLTGR